jgi:ATP-dependent Clp protease adaptor protein ClpS
MSDSATIVSPKTHTKRVIRHMPRYNIILLNDDDHTFEYVIEMMHELFNHPVEKGFEIAEKVDREGRAIVLTTTLEHAELKVDQIHSYGADPRSEKSQGSMSAELEPVE